MADWILGYQKGVQNGQPGVTGADWQRYESEVTEKPPAELKALYSAFNGGELNGGVKLYAFDQVLEAREHSEDSSWVFGEKANQRLLAARKATLASHPGLALRPQWFEETHADELVFAVHDARAGAVRVYSSLEQLLSVLVPPAQLEVFGDHTFARAMAAVEDVISDVAAKVKKKRPAPKVKAKPPPLAKARPAAKKTKKPGPKKPPKAAAKKKKPAAKKARK